MLIEQKIDHRKLRWIKKLQIIDGFYEVSLQQLKRYLVVLGIKYSVKGFYCFYYKGIPFKVK